MFEAFDTVPSKKAAAAFIHEKANEHRALYRPATPPNVQVDLDPLDPDEFDATGDGWLSVHVRID